MPTPRSVCCGILAIRVECALITCFIGGGFINCQNTGALIAEARKEHGLTQKELAGMLSVSDRTISKWERGAGFPDISLLEPLAEALDLSIAEIVTGEKNTKENTSEKSTMTDDEVMKKALAIIKEIVARQLHKKVIATSIAVVFPFLASIFFWSHIPAELAILVGTSSPYAPKLLAFTVIPAFFLVVNVVCVVFIEGRLYFPQLNGIPNPYRFHLHDPPANTLYGKAYLIVKRSLFWLVPAISWAAAVCTYIVAFRGSL